MQVAPSQISPGESFDIFYFFRDPNDTGTHYVQAKIYDVKTGALLATIGLEQAATNSRLFIKTTQSPADPVGIGRNIVAVASVYSDAAYTSPDLNYPEQEQYFLIKAALPFGGGGGGVDYRIMRELVEDVVDKKLKALPKPQPFPQVAFDKLFGTIGALQREINRVPKEHADRSSIATAIADVKEAVGNLPEPEQVDFEPVLQSLSELGTELSSLREDNTSAADRVLGMAEHTLQTFGERMLQAFEKSMEEFFQRQNLTIPISEIMSGKRAKTELPDVSHLMRA
jgi:hypothetical protein